MNSGRYIEGIFFCLVCLTSLGVSGINIRRRLLASWTGAPARLAEVILGISILVTVSQLLGIVGLFRLLPLLGLLIAIALATFWLRRESKVDVSSAQATEHIARTVPGREEAWWEPVSAIAAAGLVVAEWAGGSFDALRYGVSGVDSYWYHMPLAAVFAQSGSVLAPHNINNDNVIEFYPLTSELLHAVGIVLLGSDFLSPVVNLFWLALALFAAWCLGKRFGVASIAVIATSMVLGTIQIIASQPGSAYDDVTGAALFLSALALLASVDGLWLRGGSLQGAWVAGLAAGLTLGIKDTFIVSVAALTCCVIAVLPRGQRVRRGLIWCLAVLATGGFWYVRNAFYAGNPVPNIHLGLGPFQLPSSTGKIGLTIWMFLFSGHAWKVYFLPGVRQDLGPAWWALVALAAVGLIAGIFGIARWLKDAAVTSRHTGSTAGTSGAMKPNQAMAAVLALIGLATLIGYLFTPQPNLPGSFMYDFRFVLLTFLCGVLALPIALSRSGRVWLFLPIYGVILIGTQFTHGLWLGQSTFYHSLRDGVIVGIPFVLIGIGLFAMRRFRLKWFSRSIVAMSIALLVAAIAVGVPLHRSYLANWQQHGAYPRLARWASSVHNARIGVSGVILNYALYGSHLSNDVSFIGTRGNHYLYSDIATCAAWRKAINADKLQFVVTTQFLAFHTPPAVHWTQTDPAAKLVTSEKSITADGYQLTQVFSINRPMTMSGCSPGLGQDSGHE